MLLSSAQWGGAERFIDSASEQLGAMANSLGASSEINGKIGKDSQLLNPDKYNFKSLSPDAAKSAQVKSLFTKLAYVVARSREPGGRLSDKDIQIVIDELGGKSGSTLQMNEVLNMVKENMMFDFSQQYERMTGNPYGGFGQPSTTGIPKVIRYDAKGNRIQ